MSGIRTTWEAVLSTRECWCSARRGGQIAAATARHQSAKSAVLRASDMVFRELRRDMA